MSDDFDEQLNHRLEGLASDLGGTSLPGASAARRRAAQRTRHQITTGALAAVAAVAAGAVLVVGPDSLVAEPDPAPPARTSEPSPSEPTDAGDIPREALLSIDDLPEPVEAAWAEADERAAQAECEPVLDGMDVPHERVEFVAGDERVSHDVVRAPGDSAAGMVADIRAQVEACLPDRQSGQAPAVTDEYEVREVGDQGWLIRYYTDPEDQDAPVATVGLVLYNDIVSLTVRAEPTRMTQDTDGALDRDTPVRAAERMCTAVFDADCVGDPQFDDVIGDAPPTQGTDDASPGTGENTPEDVPDDPTPPDAEPDATPTVDPTVSPDPSPGQVLDLADEPFLTADDLNPVGDSRFDFTRAEDFPDSAESAYLCLSDLRDRGADPFLTASWFTDLDAGAAEFVLRLPDLESARRIITDHMVLPDQCGEVSETREQTVSEPVVVDVDGADEALAWTVHSEPLPDDPGSGSSFDGVAMARHANVIVVANFGAMDDATDGGWSDYAARTLATALDRAIR